MSVQFQSADFTEYIIINYQMAKAVLRCRGASSTLGLGLELLDELGDKVVCAFAERASVFAAVATYQYMY